MSLPAARRHLGYSMVEILICRKAVAGGHEITSLDSQATGRASQYACEKRDPEDGTPEAVNRICQVQF